MKIAKVFARQIFDSRGNPTVETDVILENGIYGRASVPSGASTGTGEAVELRDKENGAYGGQGVSRAVTNVNTEIARALLGKDPEDQKTVDKMMIEMDGTKNKARLGANTILSVSLAVSKAAAAALRLPLYKYYARLIKNEQFILPLPLFNIFNGGMHADFATDIQEFMLLPIGAKTFVEAMRMGTEIFHCLKTVLTELGYPITVGDEGGFAPKVRSGNTEPLELITQAIKKAGYLPGKDAVIGLDIAATVLFKDGRYELKAEKKSMSSDEMITWYKNLSNKYPIVSIEDGLSESDWDGWKKLTASVGQKIQVVGDDLLVTNPTLLQKAVDVHAANAIIIKPNQIGTLTETLDTVLLAKKSGFRTILSHRSGETEDTTIAHLAVGLAASQIKTGSLSRTERLAKYNELLRIEEELGSAASFASNLFTSSPL